MYVENLSAYLIHELKVARFPRQDNEHHHHNPHRNDLDHDDDEDDDGSEDGEETLTVYLFQFLTWPDHGTPKNPSDFLNLLFNISTYQVSPSHRKIDISFSSLKPLWDMSVTGCSRLSLPGIVRNIRTLEESWFCRNVSCVIGRTQATL